MGKGENAGNQHFLPFPQCFRLNEEEKDTVLATYAFVCKCFQYGPVQNFVIWERVKSPFQRAGLKFVQTPVMPSKLVSRLLIGHKTPGVAGLIPKFGIILFGN